MYSLYVELGSLLFVLVVYAHAVGLILMRITVFSELTYSDICTD